MVLGGGRYDRLMRKFGKEGGGLGFALYLNELDRVLASPAEYDADVLALYGPQDDAAAVLAAVEGLCGEGVRVLAATEKPAGLRVGRKLRFTGTGFEEVTEEC